MIEFIDVSKEYRKKNNHVHALKNINLKVAKGDIFGVIGFSGAGKSTLIRTVNLLETPTSGQVVINGQDLTKLTKHRLREEKKKIGMIFQHFNLLHSRNVFDNIAIPLELSKINKEEIKKRVKEVLKFVGLEDKEKVYINQLSGGQKQRVGIARALVTKPSILLCDEATSALDPQTTKSILKLLQRVNEEYGITILMITHEMGVIQEICNRVAVMKDGEIIESNNVFEVFADPQTETASSFVKSVIKDEVPASIYNQLQNATKNERIFKLKFLGFDVREPIVSEVSQRFKIHLSVLFGHITELQQIPFGNLIVQVVGEVEEVEKAINYIQSKHIQIEEVLEDGNYERYTSRSNLGNTIHG